MSQPLLRRELALIACCAVALRWLVFAWAYWSTGGDPLVREPDSVGYLALAESLATRHEFARDGQPELFRTPGYPAFLVPGLRWPNAYVVVVQGLLGGAITVLIARLASTLGASPTSARVAAWLYLIEPLGVLYASKLLTETLFVALLTAGVLALARYGRQPSWKPAAAAAAWLAASMYVRPVASYLPLLLMPAMLWLALRRRALGFRRSHSFVLLGLLAAGVAPWLLRNRLVCGYDRLSSASDVKLYFIQARATAGLAQGEWPRDLDILDFAGHLERHPEQRAWTEAERLRWMRREGAAVLRQHPWLYTRIHLREIADTLLDNGVLAWLDMFHRVPPPGGDGEETGVIGRVIRAARTKPLLLGAYAALSAVSVFYASIAAAGALLAWRSRGADLRPALGLTLLVLVYLLLVSVGPIGGHRYRLPMLPIFCVLGAEAIVVLRMNGAFRRSGEPPDNQHG